MWVKNGVDERISEGFLLMVLAYGKNKHYYGSYKGIQEDVQRKSSCEMIQWMNYFLEGNLDD